MVFPTVFDDKVADVLHDDGEFVRADVRMGVDEDVLGRAELHELVQHLPQVAPLGRPRVQLAVGKGTRAPLAVAIVRIRIHNAVARKLGHVELALMHVLAALQHHRLQAERQQLERREHAGRAGADDDDRLRIVHVEILREFIGDVLLPRAVSLVLIAPYRLLASIDGALLQHPLHPAGLGLDLLEARLPRQRAYDLELLHRVNA